MKKQVWQEHHPDYSKPDWTLRVTKGEHWVITQLQRFKSLSPGAKKAFQHILKTLPSRKK